MVNGGLFQRDATDELHELQIASYPSEDQLQRLIADAPHILAISRESEPDDRCRFVLLQREVSLSTSPTAGAAGGYVGRLDILLVDQDAILTLVEVKRSSDTRIRREVVGQMLDYAANLPNCIADIQEQFEADHPSPSALLESELGIPPDGYGEFWASVVANIEAGRIRMLFAADRIPQELRAIIEYLNRQMNATTVLGVEIRPYDTNQQTDVYQVEVIGTSATIEIRRQRTRTKTTVANFLTSCSQDEEAFYRQVFAYMDQHGITYVRGDVGFSVRNGLNNPICWFYPTNSSRVKGIYLKIGLMTTSQQQLAKSLLLQLATGVTNDDIENAITRNEDIKITPIDHIDLQSFCSLIQQLN